MRILYARSKITFIRMDPLANDGAGTSDEVSGNNFFTMTDVKQVKVKKFNTTSRIVTGMVPEVTRALTPRNQFLGRPCGPVRAHVDRNLFKTGLVHCV